MCIMAGLYLHIPFCKSRCIYCGFYSTTHQELRQQYINALCKEMVLRSENSEVKSLAIDTIYLGGGTPSQLSTEQLQQLFLYINKVYDCSEVKEVTIEMNPDDVTGIYADALPRFGVNRVSMGAQTFNDERLRFLHRRHTAAQVAQAVQLLRTAGIRNISVDLMYGFPDETLAEWENDINAAIALDVEHISAYCLMIEEGTPLAKMMPNGGSSLHEETERQMYELLMDKLTAAGYEHYEISNFARPGYRSLHNSCYWKDVPYIGLGAAAHSYDGKCRSWNVSDIRQYIESIERGELSFEKEVIDEITHYNDLVTTALRTSDGLNLAILSEQYRTYCMNEARRFLDNDLLCLLEQHLKLTRKGLFVSNYVMSSLIYV